MNAEHFLARCIPEPNSGCFLWEGCVNRCGYGVVRWLGEARLAHRVAYTLQHGDIPPGAAICHRCDNPGCVNHEHLFCAPQAENVADMDRKGRRRSRALPGEAHSRSKLSDAQRGEIARFVGPARLIAPRFGVSEVLINRIRRRKEIWL